MMYFSRQTLQPLHEINSRPSLISHLSPIVSRAIDRQIPYTGTNPLAQTFYISTACVKCVAPEQKVQCYAQSAHIQSSQLMQVDQ